MTDNPAVNAITKMRITGNIIPPSWFQHVRKEVGFSRSKKINPNGERHIPKTKPDLIAMYVLSDILYWYRATEIRDEKTNVVEYRIKFQRDKFQQNYGTWANQLGVSKKVIKSSTDILVDLGLVNREFRTVTIKGQQYNNVPFWEPVPKRIEEISFTNNTETDPSSLNKEHLLPIWVGPPPYLRGTYTENSTENSTEGDPHLSNKIQREELFEKQLHEVSVKYKPIGLSLGARERQQVNVIRKRYGDDAVLRAWEEWMKEKPDKPFRFFLEDTPCEVFESYRDCRRTKKECPICGASYSGRSCQECYWEEGMKEEEIEESRREYELRQQNPDAWYAKQQAEVKAIRVGLLRGDKNGRTGGENGKTVYDE